MNTQRTRAFVSAAWDARQAGRKDPAYLRTLQRRRLQDLVTYSRAHSRYFAEHYRNVPEAFDDVRQLPMATKAEMMQHFDDWVTDETVNRTSVSAFLADPAHIGDDYLGRYVACTTSGATGVPAILLHDHHALMIYNVLGYLRSLPIALSGPDLWALLRGKARMATIFATGGHFLSNTMMARRHRTAPWRKRTQRLLSALTPMGDLVAQLNDFQPVILGGYPSALNELAGEQQAGRLKIHPILISCAGETLTGTARRRIAAVFGCRVMNYYGTSEAVGLTFECSHQRLHVNSDWYIVEPVDEHDNPVAAGELSHGVFVTNLANKIQPIIRYQLGDRVAMTRTPCPCGTLFPPIEVIGRTDDTLSFRSPEGQTVKILPLAISSVAEETPGVAGCQQSRGHQRNSRSDC